MDETQGTPVDTSSAPGSDAGLSPTLDTDTSMDTSSDSATTSGTDSGGSDEKHSALLEKVAELEKRVSHGTKTYQELQKAQKALQQYEQRFETWRRHQVDPDEIDRAIAAATGQTGAANQPAGKALTADEVDRMVEQKISMRGILDRWESQKDAWFDANPAYDSKVARKFFDTAARETAQAELEENGAVLSSPKEIFKKAVKEWNQLRSTIEKDVTTKAMQTREKVNSQGITESKHVKPNVDRGDTSEDKPESESAWVARQNEQKARMRAGR